MSNNYLIFFLLIITASSCIIPIDNFVQIDAKNFVVIECHLTNGSFPYQQTVKLNLSSSDITDSSPNFIPNAKVYITDNERNTEFYKEDKENQLYKASPNFKGKIGNKYILHVELANGNKYQSLPETMRQAPNLKLQSSIANLK